MKKIFLLILFSGFSSLSFASLNVVTTTADLAALTQEVGGEFVQIQSLTRGDQDPHAIEPKPSYVVQLNRADLLIEIGLELEIGWLPILVTQSRNPKIQHGQAGRLAASEGISILEIPSGPVDRSMGDVHPRGNPHYWVNPGNGLIIAKNIARKLEVLDPLHADTYKKNFLEFQKKLMQKIILWEKEIAPLRGKEVVTYHKSFSYLMDWAGLKVVGLVEPKPGIPPSPAHLLNLIDLMKTRKISTILTENYYSTKVATELSKKTGARAVILPASVDGEPHIKTYEDFIAALIHKIKEAL